MAALIDRLKIGLRAARQYNTLDFFPLRTSLRGYKKDFLQGDLRAGINVALLAFPQGMAYALIAGLPIEYGIYGSAIAAIFGAFFAKSHLITLGPTNATSVLMLSAFASLGFVGAAMLALVPLLVFLVGFFIVIGAYFKVANLVQYISRSVITGYISAAALLIITNQLPNSLGLELERKGATFFDSVQLVAQSLHTIDWTTIFVSLATALLFFTLNKRYKMLPNVAICLIAVSFVTEWFVQPGYRSLFGEQSGLRFLDAVYAENWGFQLPHFSLNAVQTLASPALAIALLCILEGISIGKSLAAKTGARLDVNQAMFSIGISNVGCALFSGMPASGSLTRSSLSIQSGGHSVLATFISGALVLVGAFTVGPLTQFIPKCALAVLVIAIGLSLVNKHAIRVVTSTTKSDAIVFATTFGSGLFMPLDSAIYIGVGTSIVLFLKKVARPEMVEYAFREDGQLAEMTPTTKRSIPEVSIVHVEGELFFGAADLFQNQMRRICEDPNLKIVVLKMRNAHHMDATSVMALEELMRYINEKGRYLILSEVKADTFRALKRSGLLEEIEPRNVFTDEPANPTLSTARALKRAKEHLGDAVANVSIHVDPIRDQQKKAKSD